MPQLGRFDYTVQDTTGKAISGASVTIYREGATVNGNQSGVSPLTVTVRDAGRIASGDIVFINTATGTTYSVNSTTATTVVLAGFGGTLSLNNGDRLVSSNNQPTLYSDDQAGATTANPLTSSSTGRVQCWLEVGTYDYLMSGGGLTSTLFTSQAVLGERANDVFAYKYLACGTDGYASPGSGPTSSTINLSDRKTVTTGTVAGLQGQVINAGQSGTPIVSFIEAQAGTARINDALGAVSAVGTLQTVNSVAIHQSNATVALARPFSATIQIGSQEVASSATTGVVTLGVAFDALPPTRWAGSTGTMTTYYGLRVQAPDAAATWITAANSLSAQIQGVLQISGATFFSNSPRLESNSGNSLRIRGQMGNGGGTATVKIESGATLATAGDKICQFENPTDTVKAWIDKDGQFAPAGLGPVVTAGAGAPTATLPKGSIFMRSDGGVGTTLYVTQGAGVWNAVAGV